MVPLAFNSGPERQGLGTDKDPPPQRLVADTPLHPWGAPRLGRGRAPQALSGNRPQQDT